jgi:hypothetical protein
VSGAFRFVSGSGPKQGYSIHTAMGTIGVRGTIIQFWVTPGQIVLQLDEGGALFCAGARCVGLDKPGTYLVATATQISAPQSKDKECGASGGSTSCQITGKDDILLLQFLDRRTFNDVVTSAAPVVLPPPPTNVAPPAGVPQSKYGVPFPPETANLAFGAPLPPAPSPPPLPPPSSRAAPLTKYGVPLPPAIANRVYTFPQK